MRPGCAVCVILVCFAATANAQRLESRPTFLAAAGIEANGPKASTLQFGAERRIAAGFGLRIVGDYTSRPRAPGDSLNVTTEAVGAGLLVSYALDARIARPYVAGGFGVLRDWSNGSFTTLTNRGPFSTRASPTSTGVCNVQPKGGNAACPTAPSCGSSQCVCPVSTGCGKTTPTIGIVDTTLSQFTGSLTTPVLSGAAGALFRFFGVSAFAEARATYAARAWWNRSWNFPVTIGVMF